MNKNFDKINNLNSALRAVGIKTVIYWDAEWYCTDGQVHIGIELATDMDYGEDRWSFIFDPNGQYKDDCTKCPIKK